MSVKQASVIQFLISFSELILQIGTGSKLWSKQDVFSVL